MSDTPSISVVIPVFDGERTLGEAIESVLAQPRGVAEILVVDDGSTDGSAAVAQTFGPPVQVLTQPRSGIGAARNRGIEAATGERLTFLDADDLWSPDKLEVQLQAMADDPTLDMVFGHVLQFQDVAGQPPRDVPPIMSGAVAGTMMAHARVFQTVGLFATQWKVGEFIDWFLRARECGIKSVVLPEVLLRRRLHGANTGMRERGSRPDYARILKASLDRRRASKT